MIGLLTAALYLVLHGTGAGSAIVQYVALHPEYGLDDIGVIPSLLCLGALFFAARRLRELRREAATCRCAEERLDRAQEIAGIGSWELDLSTNRYTWSKQMYRLRGLSSGSFDPSASAVAAFVHPEDEPSIRRFRDDLKRGFARDPIEGRFIRPDGEERILRVEGQPVVDSDGVVRRICGTMRDVTEDKLVKCQLARAQKLEVIGHLSGGLAHDFNNLLGIIIGSLELQQDYLTNPLAAKFCKEALSAALTGAELTRQLLAYARRQPLIPRNVGLNDLVRDTLTLLARLLGEDIELRLDLQSDLWPALADPAQLEAALANLACNARDAMPHGGALTLATRNLSSESNQAERPAELKPGDYVVLDVADTGTGIAPEILDKIFEPFFTTKEVGKGSGLGLSMIYGLMAQTGGHLGVRSELGVGTSFSLYLPRSREGQLAPRTRPASAAPLVAGGSETLLVVEDDPRLRRVTVRHLVDLGYRVFEAPDARAATVILKINAGVELLLTDVVMPGEMDGIALVAWARALRPELGCLAMSGYVRSVDHKQRLQSLGCKLLPKPYRREELARAVREALDCREQLEPITNRGQG